MNLVQYNKCSVSIVDTDVQNFYMKLVQYNECLVSIMDTDGLML